MSVRKLALQMVSLAVLVASVGACRTAPQESTRRTLAETDVAPAEPAVQPAAVAIVKRAAERVRNAPTLSVEAITGFDVLQESGQKLEFGSSWSATIQRPNRAHLSSQRRDGVRSVVVLDGNDIWVYSPDHEVYGHEPQPGDIDASFNHLLDRLGISTPLSNLFSSELGSSLDDRLVSCYLVGDSTIAGRLCHHVAARNDYVDFQLWIDQGDEPLLRRLVVSYREEEGQPQYWAHFLRWELGVKPAPGLFVFQPPAGAELIRLAHVGEGEE